MTLREPVLILAATLAVGALAFAERLPARVELGSLLALAALALLLQGLVRDLHTLTRLRRAGAAAAPTEERSCICLESTIGLGTIFVGVGLIGFGFALPVPTPAPIWIMLTSFVWWGGYATRDVVLQWRPWALRRVRNHGSILVRWRS